MKCTNCGIELGDNMKFCRSCGTPVSAQEPVPRANAFKTTY